jgi:hypothetical protein
LTRLGPLVVLLLFAWPSEGWSCKCGPQEFRVFDPLQAPFIFVGEVATIEGVERDPRSGRAGYRKACLDSEFSAYGVPADNRRVCVVTGDHDCGVDFRIGQHYLVFAGESEDAPPDAGFPFTDDCFGTMLIRHDSPPVAPPSTSIAPLLVSLLIGFAAGLLVLTLRRRSREPRRQ